MTGGRLGRYLAGVLAGSVLRAAAVLLALYLSVDLVRESRDLEGDYGLLDVLRYLAATAPARLYDLFGFALLIGGMIGMARLAAQRELVAMRACGFHRSRIVTHVLATGFVLGCAVMLMGESVAPGLEASARIEREQLRGGAAGIGDAQVLWVRDRQRMVRIGMVLWDARGEVEFADVRLYQTDPDRGLVALISAESARHRDGRWRLHDVRTISPLDGTGTESSVLELESALSSRVFRALATRPRLLPIHDILRIQSYLEANGQDAGAYREAFWRRLYYPVNLLAMLIAGLPLLFQGSRRMAPSLAVFVGISLGVCYVVAQRLMLGLVPVLPLPPGITHLLPPMMFALLGLVIARRVR